ncbi:MAG: hypothetical protein V7L22_03685 [Nostoc sp.]|uniref:hypothetical protein n=1 Tax=Nostoc sp. TaxID=1180 RepID=UPI002FF58597
MGCFVVTVSITYKLKAGFSNQNPSTVTHTSPCLASPFTIELDRSADGVFLNYNGGRWLAEGGWVNYDLLDLSIVDQTPCTGCTPGTSSYDCINGTCTLASKYSTPGLYTSLSDCQAVCANGGACAEGKKCVDPTTFCPDGKVCIDQGEFSTAEALISKIGSEVC